MSLKKFVRRITGTEPDYWDFQLVDLLDWKQYVLFDGISPEGEQVYLKIGEIERKGRGAWFLDIDPYPNDMPETDAVLLFMDQAFDWHRSVLPGVGQRYIVIGQLHFDVIAEGGFSGTGKGTRRFLKRFRAQKGEQKVLLVEIIPFTPDSNELKEWYQAAQAKIDFEKVRRLPARLIELRAEVERLKAENAALVDENRTLKAQIAVLFGELNRIKAKFPAVATDEAVTQLLTELNLQKLEELEEQAYGRPSVWDLVLRRRRATPSAKVRDEIEEFQEQLSQVEEQLEEAGSNE